MICYHFSRPCLRLPVIMWSIAFLIIIVGFAFSHAAAGTNRHHDAHEHGVAQLNVALEGNKLYIEFSSPAVNIIGFEHRPGTKEQKTAVDSALKQLKKGDVLFLLSSESACQLKKVDVHTDIDHPTGHHGKTGHDGEHESRHTGKDAHKDKPHAADKDDRHSEFEATYHFICKKPEKLSQIGVKLFNAFPRIEHIDVQLLTGTKQTAMELTAKKNTIRF